MQFGLLVHPVGFACNARCKYCMRGKRLGDAMGGPLSLDLFRQTLRRYVPFVESPSIAWQGGEPALWGRDRFAEALEIAGDGVRHSFQTNGLLIDHAWVELFRANDILVGISLDGPESKKREMDVGRVVESICLLKTAGVHTNLLCVLTNETTLDDAAWLGQFKLPVRFIPQKPRDGSMDGVPSGEQLTAFFRKTVPALCQAGVQVLNVEAACRALMGQPTDCELQPECGPPSLVIEPDGAIYPCDHFVSPEWKIGSIQQLDEKGRTLAEFYKTSRGLKRFREMKSWPVLEADPCPQCPSVDACHRGCPADRCNSLDALSRFCEAHLEVGHMARAARNAFLKSEGLSPR